MVGDIHGCYEELMRLLEDIDFSDQDILVAVGDFVDRGPATWEVARFFRDTFNAFSVMGNHERRLAGAIRGTIQPAWSQLHSLSKLALEKHPAWADYLENLPAVIETDHAVITHARLDPALPINGQEAKYTCAVGGAGVTIEVDSSGIPKWYYQWVHTAENPKAVCMGHIGYHRIVLIPKRLYALDTEVAKGARLSAVILPEGRVAQIFSGNNHYNKSLQEWTLLKISEFDPASIPIHRYFSIRKKDQRASFEEHIIQRFETYLNELNFSERLARLSVAIKEKEGDVPEPGPARGKYFMAMQSKYPRNHHKLISLSLSGKAFSIDQFLVPFQKFTLQQIDEMLAELEDQLLNAGGLSAEGN